MTLYMPLFKSCNTLKTLKQLHAHFFITGLHWDPQASTKLIESYSQMGSLHSSRLIFDTFPKPDSFMWGVLIKNYVKNQFFNESLMLYNNLLQQKGEISRFVYPSVLRACAGIGDLCVGRKVHGDVIKFGLDRDHVIETCFVCMYGELGCLENARIVFDGMLKRDVVSWSSIISGYVDNGNAEEGLAVFCEMVNEGVETDLVVMLSVAEACGELGCLRLARSVHGYVVAKGIEIDGRLGSSFVVMYSKCGDFGSARMVFENVSFGSTALWTSMISCYNLAEHYLGAVRLFISMQKCEIEINAVTILSILSSCGKLGWFREGKSVHGFLVRRALEPELEFLGPSLVELYAECGKLSYCEKMLYTVGRRNIVSWNILISTFAREGFLNEALMMFIRMQKEGLLPDSFSLASSLSACGSIGSLQLGHQVHGHVLKRGFVDDYVQNSLIDMYSKCGFIDLAHTVFNEIQQKSVVTWNSMICGFSQNGHPAEAVRLFDWMYLNRLQMNNVTFLSVIQSCGDLAHLEKCIWVHHKLITFGVRKDIYTDTALTDMYAKCGDLRAAQEVFNSMSEKNVVSWSAMIAAYGRHGHVDDAISLFDQMVKSGINPNEITFMNILSACSHAGSVEKGKLYFEKMKDYGVEHNAQHLACMVDLLSRGGDLNGAYEIINSMPFHVDASIWGSLLNGCRIYQRLDMINTIQEKLSHVQTDDTGYYTLLSNIHAEGGNWEEFGKLRAQMRDIGLAKVPGYSAIELGKEMRR